jgi:hypothetical protein
VVAALAAQVAGGLAPELAVHEREQRLSGVDIAAPPRLQQTGDAFHTTRALSSTASVIVIAIHFRRVNRQSAAPLAPIRHVAFFPPLAR